VAITVLVPDEHGLAALADEPQVVPVVVGSEEAARYAAGAALPDAVAAAEVLVVGWGRADPWIGLAARLPRLRLVQTLSAGTEQWEGRLPEGVGLSNARGAHGGTTAEWVLAALLAIHRELPRCVIDQQTGHWRRRLTQTLAGKRILVLGAGDLATQIVRRLMPFEATATLVGRHPRPGVHGPDELAGLAPQHDALVIVVPLTEETRGLVGAGLLARLPAGAVVVNAARGPVVDTDALLAELRRGRLRAALDVTDPEPLPPEHPLWQAPGVLISPHLGGATEDVLPRAWAVAGAQIAQVAAGRLPGNLVT
jgi:phosphoglycerate dehydrogenase-like enzyme